MDPEMLYGRQVWLAGTQLPWQQLFEQQSAPLPHPWLFGVQQSPPTQASAPQQEPPLHWLPCGSHELVQVPFRHCPEQHCAASEQVRPPGAQVKRQTPSFPQASPDGQVPQELAPQVLGPQLRPWHEGTQGATH